MNTTAQLTDPAIAWQEILTSPVDLAYERLADLLSLPRIQDFPRPGEARTWMVKEWMEWGSERGFVLGAKTKHGQMIPHKLWPTVMINVGGSPGDIRSAMNCAMDSRQTLINFLGRAYQCCRVLAQDKEEPQGALGAWLTLKLSGTAGQTLFERARQVTISDTPEQAFEADKLLKRLRPFYTSIRMSLIELGLTEAQADKLILLNKGRASWTFMGLSEQLIPVMKLVLGDHVEAERQALAPKVPVEPEVLGPEAVQQEVEAQSAAAQETISGSDVVLGSRAKGDEITVAMLEQSTALKMDKVSKMLRTNKTLMERVAMEVPEMIRMARSRNNVFQRLVNDGIELQIKQHAYITKLEQSDLLPQLAQNQQELEEFSKYAESLKTIVTEQSKGMAYLGKKLEDAQFQITKLKEEVGKLEEQVTDPKAEQTLDKLKKVRGLLEGTNDMFTFVENIKRASQMVSALIAAAEKA